MELSGRQGAYDEGTHANTRCGLDTWTKSEYGTIVTNIATVETSINK